MHSILQYFHKHKNLIFIVLCSLLLNTTRLDTQGFGNGYYSAAIRNMSTSFSNFFFLSFDSTGFISIDKAPVSFWLDTLITKFFGFNTIALLLPHALAGTVVSIIMYFFIRTYFPELSAFIAGLLITISPVNVAVSRTNGPDGYLLIWLLLSFWAFVHFYQTNRTLFLILSACLIGLGFHTKMLQAYLILPSLIAALLTIQNISLGEKLKKIAIFLLIVVISSSVWITIVDFTPQGIRPYVGGSQNNSAWDLALNYNGIQRLRGIETDSASMDPLKLLTGELGLQTFGFLLPLIIFSVFFLWDFSRARRLVKHYSSIQYIIIFIASVFLITAVTFFSAAVFFHPYYLSLLIIPIALLSGSIIPQSLKEKQLEIPIYRLFFLTLFLQIVLILQTDWYIWIMFVLVSAGYWTVAMRQMKIDHNYRYSLLFLFASLLITPTVWAGYTALYTSSESPIIKGGPPVSRGVSDLLIDIINPKIRQRLKIVREPTVWRRPVDPIEYNVLKSNYSGEKYFVGVIAQHHATSFILDFNIGNIMTIGGFSGQDKSVRLSEIQSLISKGEIRFFLLVDPSSDDILAASGQNISNQIPQIDGFSAINQNNKLQHNYGYSANDEIEKTISWIKQQCEFEDGVYDCKQ